MSCRGSDVFRRCAFEAVSVEEVFRVMRYACEHHIPVTPRGQGTGLVGAVVSLYGGIMLSLQRMKSIIELDQDNLNLALEPGVLLVEISKYVEAEGFFYPSDPGEKSATIGGNVSTNAGGMRAVKYGVTRDYVMGLQVVLPDGQIIETGGKVVKNSSGYSLQNLIIGSEGTLGIIRRITLKLLPLPAKAISLLIPFRDIPSAIGTVPRIIWSKSIPTAIEFMEKGVILLAQENLGEYFPDTSAACLHIYVLRDELPEEEWKEKLSAVFADMYGKAAEFGGQVSGEHGIGFAKKGYLKEQLLDAGSGLMERIKLSFDPTLILNPGKVG